MDYAASSSWFSDPSRGSARSAYSSATRFSKPYHTHSPSVDIPTSPASTVNSDRGDDSPASSIGSASQRARSKYSSAGTVAYSKPLTPRARLSLDALRRIVEIRIHHTLKHEHGPAYVMEVVVSGKDARLHIHHSARTFKEFKKLQHAVCHWSERHAPEEPMCQHCFQFISPFARQIWPGPVAYNLVPTSKMQLILCSRINDYVRQARGDHRERSASCEGYAHVLTIVAGFVFKDMDVGSL